MPHYQDVLNESFRWLDRDEHDVCEDVCPRWKATIGRMSNASLALRRIATVHLEVSLGSGMNDLFLFMSHLFDSAESMPHVLARRKAM